MAGAIAVVVTCYDLGRTIAAAIESVHGQTRPATELVVVDDGSTDLYTRESLARLEKHGTRVVRTENLGVCAARNLGARLTVSDYLLCLDADDLLEPTYFEQAAARLDADPDLHFVSCGLRAFDGASYVWSPASPPTWLDAISTGGAPHVSTLVRRGLWDAVGGFDEEVRTAEDLDFWATALDLGFRGIVLPEPLLRYRVRPGSRYRRSLRRETHLEGMRHFYVKHRDAVQRHGPALIVEKERFILQQRAHQQNLHAQRAALAQELASLRAEVDELAHALAERGERRVAWGDLQRLAPLSFEWGGDRGRPVNRFHIEKFLAEHRADITGRVLEVKDPGYTHMFGSGVTRSDVIDVDPTSRQATIVDDLSRADAIASDTFDCVILTQVLNINYDVRNIVEQVFRILKRGGVLLCTVAAVDRVSYEDRGIDGDYWRFTEASIRTLFAEVFPVGSFEVCSYGNVMACAAHLYGLAAEELRPEELDANDPWFPLIVAARAVKPTVLAVAPSTAERDFTPHSTVTSLESGAVLMYHRIARHEPDTYGLCLSPADFRAQMEYLRHHCHPMPLDELARAAAAGRLPPRAVAVTIDDGYLDALTAASPILLELEIPATFFVNSDGLDEEHEPLWDVLERVFLGDGALPPVLDLDVGDARGQRRATATREERTSVAQWLNELTYPMTAPDRATVRRRIIEWSGLGDTARPTHRCLTAPELARLAARPGHTIGSHTVHHLALPHHDRATQRWEIEEDRTRLERFLGRPVTTFGYPYGELTAATVEIVRAAGFAAAVTCRPALVTPGTDPVLVPRLEVSGGTPLGDQLAGLT